jgi:molecular chaperone DnaK (HSP70)
MGVWKMRRYTRHELENMDMTTLKAICRDLKIRTESMSLFDDKSAMIQMIYKYRGTVSERFINEWDGEKIRCLTKAITEKGEELKIAKIEIPAYFKIYKGIESLNERGSEHKVYTESDIDMISAVLIDSKGGIQAFLNISKGMGKNTYFLTLREHMLNSGIAPGIYRNFKIMFFPGDFEKILRVYNLGDDNITRFTYISKTIQEVVVHEIEETDDVLVIDYGTSYTTAGTYINDRISHIWFYSDEVCEHNADTQTRYAECLECGRCALCPSVISVKACEDDIVELMYGHEAKDRIPMARNSIFFDTKRWVNDYAETIDVKDLSGNTASIRRSEIIERFMKYIIHTAEQQNKVRYTNICFTSPVKQKAMSVYMYKDILKGYNVEEKDAIDEAVAVVYDSVAQKVETLDYEDGYERSVLLIDCGGSTSDMVKCDYIISHHKKRSNIDMTVGYANGDTNFGGNNLTYRIMQYLKIKLAQYYKKDTVRGIDELLNISYCDIFDFIDNYGIKTTYEAFEEAYRAAGNAIPTNFSDYTNDAETVYFNVRGNFYFLWNLAERIKVDLYNNSGAYEFSFDKLRASRSLYMISVRNERGTFTTYTECPAIRILRDEINLLLKPEIYNLLKKFIEPYYKEDETLSDITNIMLSGQTTKIDLFRDVLKEYIAGHKARAPFEHSYSKKIKCIRGAVKYHGDKAIGRIRPTINYESAIVPYYLTVETFNEEREKLLISQGQLLSDVSSYIDRTIETKVIVFDLKDHDREILQVLKFNLNIDGYTKTGYDELLKNHTWLKQGDVDRIEDSEVRLFIYSNDESWGFKWLGIANNNGDLFCGKERFVPFESTVWEMNFFDGKR